MTGVKKPELSAIENAMQAIVTRQPATDDNQLDYAAYLKRLPPVVADAMLAISQQEAEEISLPTLKYCLCDSPEGDYPSVYAYTRLSDLVKALHLRIGKETSVSVFFGLPLTITKIQRIKGDIDYYLRLPNQTAARLNATGELVVFDVAELTENANMEELQQGWMGDDAFLSSQYFQPGTSDPFQDSTQKNNDNDNDNGNLPS
jgi:hypothetical protein